MGPVPVSFYEETTSPKEDLSSFIQFSEKAIKNKNPILTVTPLKPFDSSNFTKRELKILENLSKEFFDTRAEDMVEATHLENRPWHMVYVVENRKQSLIPYELAVRKQESTEIIKIFKERQDFIKHFK